MRLIHGLIIVVVLALSVVIAPAPAAAATITLSDDCSLVDAIRAANTNTAVSDCDAGSDYDTIVLEAGAIYSFDTPAELLHERGPVALPVINSNITIVGNGATIERDSEAADFRLLTHVAGDLTLTDLTLRNGRADGDGSWADNGGCVHSEQGSLQLQRVTVSGCSAAGTGHAVLVSTGQVGIYESTFTSNGMGSGTVVYADPNGRITIANSTFSGNAVLVSFTAVGPGALVDLTHVTATDNVSYSLALDLGASISFRNSILTTSTFSGEGVITNEGNNLLGGDPQLGPLQNNGGTTATQMPLPGSPAIDAADSEYCPETDQRGVDRPVDGLGCDIGAVEVQATPPVLTLPTVEPVEATGPGGAVVTYNATATDYAGQSLTVTCTPPSGSTFVIATTTVSCSATDAAGQTTTETFTVTVQDTIAPQMTASAVTVPGGDPYVSDTWTTQNVKVTFSAADSGSGVALMHMGATGVWIVGAIVLSGDPYSWVVPAEGTTVWRYHAADVSGNTSTQQTFIIKIDRTAPTISGLNDITTNATSPQGAIVTFTPTISDSLSTPTVSCDRASGTLFPIGTTTVTCTVTDEADNVAQATFDVTVNASVDLLAQLRADTITYVTNPTTERAMLATLDHVKLALERGNTLGAYFAMLQYIVQLDRAVDTRAVSASNAAALAAQALRVLGAVM